LDIKTFIVEMTKALAWPLIVLVAVLAFRKPLLRLLPQLRNLKYDKLEFQFAKEVAAVEKEAQASLPPVPQESRLDAIRDKLIKLTMTSPEAAIIEAWRYLEAQQLELVERRKVDVAPVVRTMPRVLGALLYKEGMLSEAQHDLVTRLRDLRNDVTHSRTQVVDIERAVSYIESVLRLVASMQDGHN
jgi:ABC-type branched-subunit amino acid transport system ATPase component